MSIIQPDKIKIPLFKHQLCSIYNMEKLEKNNKINYNYVEAQDIHDWYKNRNLDPLNDTFSTTYIAPEYISSEEEDDINSIILGTTPETDKFEMFNFNKNLIEQFGNKHNKTYYKTTKLGILGDFAGYGKTLSILGLISRDKMLWDINTPYIDEKIYSESCDLIKITKISKYNKLPCSLVLVSASIICQWENEIKRTELSFASIKTKKDIDDIYVENYDVIFVIPSLYNQLVITYGKSAWKRFIFDEPSSTKVSGMKDIKAGFYWFITATPYDIFRNHSKCSKNTFMREIVGTSFTQFQLLIRDIIIKNDDELIRESFKMPETFFYTHKCRLPIYNVVHNLVSDNISNMIEIGNIEGAILALGGNKTSNLYELLYTYKNKELTDYIDKIELYKNKNDIIRIKEFENKKRFTMRQLEELNIRFKDMLNDPCNICYENLKSPVIEIHCQNLFCGECLLTWLKYQNTCPLCRTEIINKDLIYIQTKNDDIKSNTKQTIKNDENTTTNMTKAEKIVDIIKNNKKGKFLIFSDHDGSFTTIKTMLNENNINCEQIRGNSKNIEKRLSSFKNDENNVIFLNSRHNGAGINLQEATDIILYHNMADGIKQQLIGRANRIGRINTLNVHLLQI